MMAITIVPSWDNRLGTSGIKANREKVFSLPFTGLEIYALLELLQTVVEAGGNYPKLSQYALGAEMIRGRAEEQGF
jgi:hypothetical protein